MSTLIDRALAAATVYNTHRTATLQAQANAQMGAILDLEQQRRVMEEQQDHLREAVFDAQGRLETFQDEANPHRRLYLGTVLMIRIQLQGIAPAVAKSFEDKDRVKKLLDGVQAVRLSGLGAISSKDAEEVDWCARMAFGFGVFEQLAAAALLYAKAPSGEQIAGRVQREKAITAGVFGAVGFGSGILFSGFTSALVLGVVGGLVGFFVEAGNMQKLRLYLRDKSRPADYAECLALAQKAGIPFGDQTDAETVRREFARIAQSLDSLNLAGPESLEEAPALFEKAQQALEACSHRYGLV